MSREDFTKQMEEAFWNELSWLKKEERELRKQGKTEEAEAKNKEAWKEVERFESMRRG